MSGLLRIACLLWVGGAVFLDIDNDSDLDLYVGNGYVPGPAFLSTNVFQNDQLYLNNGNLDFANVSSEYGIENKYTTRGVSYSDYDNDGDLDILAVVENVPVNNLQWATVLYNNQLGNTKNWFQATLEGVEVNRDAYGSKVYLYAGGKTLAHEISGGGSHASHVSIRAHFGLGDIGHIDSLQIVWTGGKRTQTLYYLEINQHIYVVEDTSSITSVNNIEVNLMPFQFDASPNPSNGELTIKLNNLPHFVFGEIGICNIIGELIENLAIRADEKNIPIDLSKSGSGIYFISLKIDGEIFTKKIIIR